MVLARVGHDVAGKQTTERRFIGSASRCCISSSALVAFPSHGIEVVPAVAQVFDRSAVPRDRQGLRTQISNRNGFDIRGGVGRNTIARVSYQRFFRRYLRLAGMTGTASNAAAELWSVYGLKVAKSPMA